VKLKVSVSGFRELDKALGELPKAVARNVLRRVLTKAAQPVADMASSLAPKDKGELSSSVKVGTKTGNKTGKAEYAAAMKAGLGKGEALKALRSARRGAAGRGFFAEAFVGPTKAKSKKDAIKRIVQEFGSVNQPGQPYLRPAWDAQKHAVLERIKAGLGPEITKTAKRLAKRRAAKAAKLAKG